MFNIASNDLEITVVDAKSNVVTNNDGTERTTFMLKGIAKTPGSPMRGQTVYMNTDALATKGDKFIQPGGTYQLQKRSYEIPNGPAVNLVWLKAVSLLDAAEDVIMTAADGSTVNQTTGEVTDEPSADEAPEE